MSKEPACVSFTHLDILTKIKFKAKHHGNGNARSLSWKSLKDKCVNETGKIDSK